MDSNKGRSSRYNAGPARGETRDTGKRLDNILNRQSTRPRGAPGSLLSTRLDQRPGVGSSSGSGGSRQPSTNQNASFLGSALDRPGRGNSTLRNSVLNPLDKSRSGAQPGSEYRPATKTAFKNPHDIAMASRQVNYETLTPQEKQKQEDWAQQKIQELGPCPVGFSWIRVPGGYNCVGGNHWMCDELVAEGKGGFRVLAQFQGFLARGRLSERELGFSDGLTRYSPPFYSMSECHRWSVSQFRGPSFAEAAFGAALTAPYSGYY